MTISTIGLDIAKSVFQVHAIDAVGRVMLRKRLPRAKVLDFFRNLEPCLVGIEACATSHFWAREIGALGHRVRLMPAQYVKPYVKRHKNDMTDAEAICEAVQRPNMRFVEPKSAEQQSVATLHNARALLVKMRILIGNTIGHTSRSLGSSRPKEELAWTRCWICSLTMANNASLLSQKMR